MSKDKGRMLARTGWQGWDCECCGEPATKGQNRAREKRAWQLELEREAADELWTGYFGDAHRESLNLGIPESQARNECEAFADQMVGARRAVDRWPVLHMTV